MAALQSAKLNHKLQERFSLRLYCSSIFHSLTITATSGGAVSSSPFCQTNEIVLLQFHFCRTVRSFAKWAPLTQWFQPFLHTKCVGRIWKIQNLSWVEPKCQLPTAVKVGEQKEKTRKTCFTSRKIGAVPAKTRQKQMCFALSINKTFDTCIEHAVTIQFGLNISLSIRSMTTMK